MVYFHDLDVEFVQYGCEEDALKRIGINTQNWKKKVIWGRLKYYHAYRLVDLLFYDLQSEANLKKNTLKIG